MSYYTYFKPIESYYKDYNAKDLEFKISKIKGDTSDAQNTLILACVKAYYMLNKETNDVPSFSDFWGTINSFYKLIKMYVNSYVYERKNLEDFEMKLTIINDDDHELWYNHFNDTEYDLQEFIDNFDENINDCVLNICTLCLAKYEPDTKYSDTPKSDYEYVKSDFITRIQEEIESINYFCENYNRAKVLLDCWDTKEGEEERYVREHPSEQDEDVVDDANDENNEGYEGYESGYGVDKPIVKLDNGIEVHNDIKA